MVYQFINRNLIEMQRGKLEFVGITPHPLPPSLREVASLRAGGSVVRWMVLGSDYRQPRRTTGRTPPQPRKLGSSPRGGAKGVKTPILLIAVWNCLP